MVQTETLRDVLQFYADAGVDIALDEAPRNRIIKVAVPDPRSPTANTIQPESTLTQSPKTVRHQQTPNVEPAQAAQPVAQNAISHETILQDARERAAAATTLDELMELQKSFDGCGLKKTAKTTVFEDGNRNSKIMLIGEAPRRDEDIQGKPFVGRAGQLLDKMLSAIELDRNSVYLANVLPWRPPGNRTPTAAEMELCKPFITRQIELFQPELLLFLGGLPAKSLLETTDGILKLRGKWRAYSPTQVPALSTLHPEYLLRQPAQKRLVWRDLLNLKNAAKDKGIFPTADQ
ncbi:MAG: uracil-DNA glycosylase [Hyphomicrobiales bacterium]